MMLKMVFGDSRMDVFGEKRFQMEGLATENALLPNFVLILGMM